MTDHDHLRTLAENATPGPWEIDALENGEHGLFISNDHPEAGSLGCASSQVAGFMVERNAEFIAAANPTAVLALLDELAAREAEVHRLRELADTLRRKGAAQVERCNECSTTTT